MGLVMFVWKIVWNIVWKISLFWSIVWNIVRKIFWSVVWNIVWNIWSSETLSEKYSEASSETSSETFGLVQYKKSGKITFQKHQVRLRAPHLPHLQRSFGSRAVVGVWCNTISIVPAEHDQPLVTARLNSSLGCERHVRTWVEVKVHLAYLGEQGGWDPSYLPWLA